MQTKHPISWSYGITTVPQRKTNLLPATLASLNAAGFDRPRIFLDSEPSIGIPGCWLRAAMELWVRNPKATYYVVFQDDLLAYRNLRIYLDHCEYPPKGYWNLYTHPRNEGDHEGWHTAKMRGNGALGLVLDRETLLTVLTDRAMLCRTLKGHNQHRNIDGGIYHALNKAGYSEYVHTPSLLYHTGKVSTKGPVYYGEAASFRGPHYDAMDLLTCNS